MAKRTVTEAKRRPTSGSVLVVDDETELSALIEDMLEASGYQVETAPDGAAALARLERDRFDMILSDVHMPVLDGPALYRELEHRRPDLAQRMVFMTGHILNEDTADFFAATGARCLRKPFMSEDLHRIVEQVLAPPVRA